MLNCWGVVWFSLLLLNLLFLSEVGWFHETVNIIDFFVALRVYQILNLVKMQFVFSVAAKISKNGISILRMDADFCWQKASHENQNWISCYNFSLWVNHEPIDVIESIWSQNYQLLHLVHNFTVHFYRHVENLSDWEIDLAFYHRVRLFGWHMGNFLLFEYFFSEFPFQRWKYDPQKFTIWNLIDILGPELVPEKRLSIRFEDEEVLGCCAQIIGFQKFLQANWAHDSIQSQCFIWFIFEYALIFWKWFEIRHFAENFSSGFNFSFLIYDGIEDPGHLLWDFDVFWGYFVRSSFSLRGWFLRFVGSI